MLLNNSHLRRLVSLVRNASTISYQHQPSSIPFLSETIGERFRKSTDANPDQTFCVFKKQNVKKTYAEVLQDSRTLAASLHNLGLKVGDRVGIWGPNYYEWITTHFACALGGFVLVNVNPYYKAAELQYALRKVEVSALITPHSFKTSRYFDSVADIIPEIRSTKEGDGNVRSHLLPHLKHFVVFDTDGSDMKYTGAWNYIDLLEGADSKGFKSVDDVQSRIHFDDPFNIQFTSGTTGHPKAATLTHHGILNNAYFTGLNTGFREKKHVICIPNPLYHTMGCVAGLMNAMIHSQTSVFPSETFNAGAALESIQSEKVTFVYGTPTMFIDILNHPQFKQTDVSTVTGGYIAAAPVPPVLCERMLSEMNMKDIVVLYGCTETSPVVTLSRFSETPQERIKNCGYAIDHVEIGIMDGQNRFVSRGSSGELVTRGFHVLREYWRDAEKTREAKDVNGWYHTGDTATMDENGAVKIVGRTKDMIIRGGENVYPTEIEQFLLRHPDVADAYIIGVPDPRLGEEICAWIRLKEGRKLEKKDITEFCKGKIAQYKIPRYILFKTEHEIPLTATGKVQKFQLREISKRELGLGQVESHFNE